MTIILKKAEIQDAETILRINTAAFNHDSRIFGDGGDGGPPGYNKLSHVQNKITNAAAYKILLYGKIIGWFYFENVDENTVQLYNFSIDPSQQNRGFGVAALEQMERLIPKNITRWVLKTPRYGVKYQHIYEKVGFRRVDDFSSSFLLMYEKPVNGGIMYDV